MTSIHKAGNVSFMDMAIAEAEAAAMRGEVPVGAVLVRAGKVLARNGNRMRELSDPTAHAEIMAIREACHALGSDRLPDVDLYVSLEPCTMCAGAISFARIRRLYFAASDAKGGGVLHGSRFYARETCHHAPEVYDGIGAEQSRAVLKRFFQERRGLPPVETSDPE